MSKNMKKLIILILMFSLFLTNCLFVEGKELILVDNNECLTPCFLGITAGITSEVDAKKIISTNAFFENCQEFDYTLQGGFSGIECNKILIMFKDEVVEQIGYSIKNTTLNQIINKFNLPSYVFVVKGNLPEYSPRVKAGLWYQDIYAQITLPEIEGDIYIIEPNTKVESITFYSENRYHEITNQMDNLLVWKGFDSYLGESP